MVNYGMAGESGHKKGSRERKGNAFMNFRQAAEAAGDYIIQQRRWFHRHPELSLEERRTTDKIQEELEKLGYEVHRYPDYNGCWCMLEGGAGRTVALRADIDALPVLEKTGLPFASENEGVMHACGHDCHIAMLLGAARLLMEHRDQVRGRVKLLFQSGEETCHGSEYYVEHGFLDGVDAIMGQHIWGKLEEPFLNFQPGRRMASCDNFSITVEGVSAHGTQPELGADALVAAASILMNLQTFASRNNDPLNPLVVTVGEMRGGQRFNIIANHAELHGTVRTFDPAFRKSVEGRLRQIAEHTAAALGVRARLDYHYYCSPIVNDDDFLNGVAQRAVEKLYGPGACGELPMAMGSEDFGYFADRVPAVFGFLGSRNEALGYTAGNHNDRYTVHEPVLIRGAAMYAQFAADYLEAAGGGEAR